MSQGEAARAVKYAPGHTVHWYRQQGLLRRFRWGWLYRDFATAWKNGKIFGMPGKKKGETIYFPNED